MRTGKQAFPINIPIQEPMEYRRATVYEHTPVDPYRGEYPRFIRPVGAHQPRSVTVWVQADSHDEAVAIGLRDRNKILRMRGVAA